MNAKGISKKFVLSIISLLLTIFCLELSLRLVWDNYEWWSRRPGTDQYLYPINQYGFRDYEYTKKKPKNTIRIVATGDSFTYGAGIKFDDTWSKRLERSLNTLYSPQTGKNYEVLNISWPGYSTFQEANKLDFIEEFEPDMLILGYCLNDTEDWAREKNVIALRHRFHVINEKPSKSLRQLFEYSHLISYFGYKWSNIKIGQGTIKYYAKLYSDSYSGWQRTAKSFTIFSRQEFPVIVALFPLLSYPFEKYPFLNIHAIIGAELDKNDLPFIDFYEHMKHEDFMRLQVKPFRDPHPNEIACRIIETKLFEELTANFKPLLSGEENTATSITPGFQRK